MNLKRETRGILLAHGVTPSKRLGQSFLVDEGILQKIVSYASLSREDTVLEVGSGLGFLTERLAGFAGRVVAVELDLRLMSVLKARLSSCRNVSLMHGDILKLKVPSFDKVVSTPPYSISSPLLFWLFEKEIKLAVLAFQEEFANRLAASVGSKEYGRLTVATYYRAEVELLDRIQKELFWPSPNVDSRIVRLKPRKPPFSVDDETFFFETVNAIFTQRNKKLRNAVMPLFGRYRMPKTEALRLADSLPFHSRRPRELSPEEISLVAQEAAEMLRRAGVSRKNMP
jgi:16S rRNA (adenine1518-N6/adenine1519-N6)-dimethyltransferase